MDREYYRQYYNFERNHWWFKVRSHIIGRKVKNISGGRDELRILNIGAASGHTSELLNQFGSVKSVEYDKDCCDFLRDQLNMDVVNASITALPFDNSSFDLVCAFDVIEHVDDDQKAVEEMIRVCSNNGFVFITVPAFMDLWSNHDEINHHKRRYLLRQIKELFKNKPGQVIFKSYFNTLLFPLIYVVRKLINTFPKLFKTDNKKSDFELGNNKIINSALYGLFSIERILLRCIKLPFGVSILLMFKKNYADIT